MNIYEKVDFLEQRNWQFYEKDKNGKYGVRNKSYPGKLIDSSLEELVDLWSGN